MRTLYRAERIHTLSSPPTGEWLLVDGRHVERVGAGDPPQADRVVELPGTTVLPGFVDAHAHLTETGGAHLAPDLTTVRSAAELLSMAREHASVGHGPTEIAGFDESGWADRTLPTIAELDAASPRALVLVRVDGHLSLANQRALEASGALHHEGVERDAQGSPTGRVTRKANETLGRWLATNRAERDIEELQLEAAGLAVSHGVTSIHEMSMPRSAGIRDLEILLKHRERLPLDVVPYVATTDISQVIDLGLPRIGGDLSIDGSVGARTAWVSEPYEDTDREPAGYFHDDVLVQFFHDAHLAGLQVAVHAIGDAAIEQVVRAWERVSHSLDSRQRRHFRARRHRAEHFEMPGATVLERAAMLGLAISVQSTFDAEWGGAGGLYEQALGAERAAAMNPFRNMLYRGMELGAGSDSPVTTIDPMASLAAFETHHDPAQRLSRAEAVRVATMGSARLAHQEDKKGSLEPGKHADFAVYDVDPLEAQDLSGVRPVLTVSLGREVFAR